jgi:hypothetical protein
MSLRIHKSGLVSGAAMYMTAVTTTTRSKTCRNGEEKMIANRFKQEPTATS